jgi:hypothetical protein
MTSVHSNMLADLVKVELAMPDTASVAQSAVEDALDFCAQQLRLADRAAVLEQLQEANPSVRGYFEYGLARQIGERLGELDGEVEAVYLYDDEATPEDAVFGESTLSLVHLILRVQRKTSALQSLVAALDRAVTQKCAEMLHATQLAHVLDVQVVDDVDVNTKMGYGALLTWLHHKPLVVWTR